MHAIFVIAIIALCIYRFVVIAIIATIIAKIAIIARQALCIFCSRHVFYVSRGWSDAQVHPEIGRPCAAPGASGANGAHTKHTRLQMRVGLFFLRSPFLVFFFGKPKGQITILGVPDKKTRPNSHGNICWIQSTWPHTNRTYSPRFRNPTLPES